jgi:DNA-binding LacI/PurR family transcriptional regulator
MASLRDVAREASVPIRTAYKVLSGTSSASGRRKDRVLAVAKNLGYRLQVTLRDVAEEAKVSVTTVSYVLSNSPEIGAATRKRVLNAVDALDYRVNNTARSLKVSRTHMIGYPWHTTEDPERFSPVLDRFLYRVAATAESFGYHLLTFTESHSDVTTVYKELIRGNHIDGFVLSQPTYGDRRIHLLRELDIPFVSFGRSELDTDLPYIEVDGALGIAKAVDHLVQLGHQKIAFLGLAEALTTADNRLHGFRTSIAKAGLSIPARWIVRVSNTRQHAAAAARRIMGRAPRPTAFVCSSDILALGVNAYLQGAGLRMGTDVAVTGYDDEPIADYVGLTSLRQPIDQIGTRVVQLLYSLIRGEDIPERQILLEPELVVRSSSQATNEFIGQGGR